MKRVLVVGSYPPIPGPASPHSVQAVREAWSEGYEVTVASPRVSAAHLAVPIVGVLGGRRLARAKAVSGAERLVLCAEAGMPLPVDGRPGLAWRQRQAARLLAQVMRTFEHCTLLEVGELEADRQAVAILEQAADEVRHLEPAGDYPSGVSVLGPLEMTPADRARQLANMSASKLLGPYWPPLRDHLVALRRRRRRREARSRSA